MLLELASVRRSSAQALLRIVVLKQSMRASANIPDALQKYFFVAVKICSSVDWEKVKCSVDADQAVPEGRVPIGRFPWLGVVQHKFYVGGQVKFAVTAGVLVHPAYAIASAEDIARVPRTHLFNNTKFILWNSENTKIALDVQDYLLHPEYEEKVTFATLALLELITYGYTGISDYKSVVLPICMPVTGAGTFDKLYSVRYTDDGGEINKEVNRMTLVPHSQCEEFYYQTGLSYDKMKPRRPLCASVESQKRACVWDAGSVLFARQSWGHWMILGFSTRGAGCGAPARFVSIHDFIPWIDDVITKLSPDEMDKLVKVHFRRDSPFAFKMYAGDVKLPKEFGQCGDRRQRGTVIYKDSSEVLTTKAFSQGFFFMSVANLASVNCINVELDTLSRTNAAVWVEHQCRRDMTNQAWTPKFRQPDYRKLDCFMYFRSKSFIEFRFFFTFKATFEVTIYGRLEATPLMPNPNNDVETTIPWHPTEGLHKYMWHPANKWMWHL
ncbi:uncharacterized protein LOC128675635 [Plodia interpunctella]|uniref:uncharacterized protein LOC128675635 n=1 Tax=Plodia interpunctella TaxID=58824 RepID=UPI0023680CC7|nr:uncharacterized protein LOC128675635 [Plodia interpunctella]